MALNRHILARRCLKGCIWLHEYDDCPNCGGRLVEVKIPSRATLISNTTVRVNPSGSPIRLGVARAAGGATTLCIIEGKVRGYGRDRVHLVLRNGRYHALARGARLVHPGG